MIGLVGKYNELPDAYKSIYESFVHAGAVNECDVEVVPIHSESLEKRNVEDYLEQFDGILVAPGFGKRGIEGKIKAIQIVREKNIPFFGICLGMQCAVVEFCRNVIGLTNASSTEVNSETMHPVIDLMPEQKKITKKGGTMRLGAYNCKLKRGTKSYKAYGKLLISERHRHRYEFNNEYLSAIQDNGLLPTGINPESNLVEIVELKGHPFFIGVQYHPELKSTVENPHPLFVSFVAAAMNNKVHKK
jgi:CTP synthase